MPDVICLLLFKAPLFRSRTHGQIIYRHGVGFDSMFPESPLVSKDAASPAFASSLPLFIERKPHFLSWGEEITSSGGMSHRFQDDCAASCLDQQIDKEKQEVAKRSSCQDIRTLARRAHLSQTNNRAFMRAH